MNFKKLTIGAAIATALIGSVVGSAPAEAVTINKGSVLRIQNTPNGGVQFLSPLSRLNFFSNNFTTGPFTSGQQASVGSGSTGTFLNASSAPNPPLAIRDFAFTGPNTPSIFERNTPLPNFISGLDVVGGDPTGDDVQFDLAQFIYNSTTGNGTLSGTFKSGTFTIGAKGRFTSDLENVNPSRYQIALQAVPTPALLPGLVGMGLAALRKRKGEAAEAVKVNA